MRAVVKLTIPAQKCGCPPEDGIAAVLRDSLHLPNTTAGPDSGLALPNSTADPDSGLALPNTTASPYPELSLPNTTAGPNQDADLENIAVASGKNPCQNNGSTAIVPAPKIRGRTNPIGEQGPFVVTKQGIVKVTRTIIKYKDLDELGRPTGIEAVLVRPLPAGSIATIDPPGFDRTIHQRGHLLANSLGGSGSDARNIASMLIRVNLSDIKKVEYQVRRRVVNWGEAVYYKVTPIYNGSDLVPEAFHIVAIGDQKVNIDITIPNR